MKTKFIGSEESPQVLLHECSWNKNEQKLFKVPQK